MTCAEAMQAILEADPSDLEGLGEGGFQDHLRACSRCQAAARAVLEEEKALAMEMVAAVPLPDLDGLLAEAAISRGSTPKRFSPRFRKAGFTLLPLAAAAAMVGLFLGSEPPLPGAPYTVPERPPGLGLEIPEGRNVAVLATNDPDITVLWFF